jgi:hypothetical protein
MPPAVGGGTAAGVAIGDLTGAPAAGAISALVVAGAAACVVGLALLRRGRGKPTPLLLSHRQLPPPVSPPQQQHRRRRQQQQQQQQQQEGAVTESPLRRAGGPSLRGLPPPPPPPPMLRQGASFRGGPSAPRLSSPLSSRASPPRPWAPPPEVPSFFSTNPINARRR